MLSIASIGPDAISTSCLCLLRFEFCFSCHSDRLIDLRPCLSLSGLILSFYSGAYVTAVGATNAFGNDSSKLIGLCGMSIGVGEILGGGLFGLMGKRFNRRGRSPIILFGFILHLIAFVFTFLNLPDDSTTGKTEHQSYLTPR